MNDTSTEASINFGKAKEYFQTVKQECGSQSTRAELYLAMVYNKEGDYRSSTSITEKICRQTGDGRLTATVMYANAFLQHGQNKESTADREKNFKTARSFYYSALKSNYCCISAASGLALSWLLFGHAKEARNQLRIVKENQPRLAGPAEALANAYLSGQGTGGSGESNPTQAAIEFEECNRAHFDRTNTQNFNGAYNAYKLSGKIEECLTMAEYMIQLEPDRPVYWYYLASSILKYVTRQTSSHSVDIHNIRVKDVDRYTNQLKRARQLFVIYGKAENKIQNIDTYLLKKLEKLRKRAIENDLERRNRLASSIPEISITEEENTRNK
jgi:tetratricopeptide (TPR) repeat protein